MDGYNNKIVEPFYCPLHHTHMSAGDICVIFFSVLFIPSPLLCAFGLGVVFCSAIFLQIAHEVRIIYVVGGVNVLAFGTDTWWFQFVGRRQTCRQMCCAVNLGFVECSLTPVLEL